MLIVISSISIIILVVVMLALSIIMLLSKAAKDKERDQVVMENMLLELRNENRELRQAMDAGLDRMRNSQVQLFDQNRDASQKTLIDISRVVQDGLHNFLKHTSSGMEKIRDSVDTKLTSLQSSNEKKLDEMRNIVDEKLAKTLENRLKLSFDSVSTQLESVNKSIGEMKTVAQSVGSLNRILSGSKSRGILGEVQLGQIIEDMLPPQLYDKEVATVPGSRNRVEYAVKLPGTADGQHVYLPIDSKFPLDPYERLLDAYDAGEQTENATKELQSRVKAFAKDIREKYISPPDTTHFAVMFLPTEGLYAEITRNATFFEELRQGGIVIAGPTTLSAMLNSLQLGFKTLQLQKGAVNIEKTLGAAKKEFETFNNLLKNVQKRITSAGDDLDKLVGVRTRAINRSLRDVQLYTGDDTEALLGMDMANEEDE